MGARPSVCCLKRRRHPNEGSSESLTSNTVEIKVGCCNADPITKQGKRIQMAQMMCVPLFPIVVLIVQTVLTLAGNLQELDTLKVRRR